MYGAEGERIGLFEITSATDWDPWFELTLALIDPFSGLLFEVSTSSGVPVWYVAILTLKSL
jgi:hypothetical protein